ncbi:MAG TPA: PaaI family thioesterase [Acidimicrobiales bacterium]|nr:PaaI family thioesterase [Acidimicrobiales bacterium]
MNDTSTQFLHERIPLCAMLGIRAGTRFGADGVALLLDWSAEMCTGDGMLHGGILMALADSAGGMCAYLNLPPGAAGTATIESKTNFLRAVRSGTVMALAAPLHIGSRTIVVETDVRDESGSLAAKVIQTQIVLSGAGS